MLKIEVGSQVLVMKGKNIPIGTKGIVTEVTGDRYGSIYVDGVRTYYKNLYVWNGDKYVEPPLDANLRKYATNAYSFY